MNTDSIKSALTGIDGLYGWSLRIAETESTTIIRLPTIVTFKDGKPVTTPNPLPHEVITAPTENAFIDAYTKSDRGMGQAVGQIESDEPDAVRAAVAPLVAAGLSQSSKPWSLTPGTASFPEVKLADPALAGATPSDIVSRCQQFNEAIVKAASADTDIQVSNIEAFVRRTRQRVLTSTGIALDFPLTRFETEVCFVCRPGQDRVAEYTGRLQARRLADLDPQQIAHLCATSARQIALAGSPPQHEGPVTLSGEAAADFFSGNPVLFHANARYVYEKTARYERGRPITADEPVKGDRLTLTSDPLIAYGSDSNRFSPYDAMPAARVVLVKDGNYEGLGGARRFVEYLGMLDKGLGPALPGSNIVVAAGTAPAKELKSADGVVVHAFSDWQADQASGDFACEIRLAELRRGGEVKPFRGGLLVGNWFKALTDARYSKETTAFRSYYGPAAIRLGSLQVAG
jgi:predicted Zn-dependent protease